LLARVTWSPYAERLEFGIKTGRGSAVRRDWISTAPCPSLRSFRVQYYVPYPRVEWLETKRGSGRSGRLASSPRPEDKCVSTGFDWRVPRLNSRTAPASSFHLSDLSCLFFGCDFHSCTKSDAKTRPSQAPQNHAFPSGQTNPGFSRASRPLQPKKNLEHGFNGFSGAEALPSFLHVAAFSLIGQFVSNPSTARGAWITPPPLLGHCWSILTQEHRLTLWPGMVPPEGAGLSLWG
jgi:hypothetical protein